MSEEANPVIAPVGEWGTISLYDQQHYISVIANAVAVHIDRERVRRGLWKEADAKDQFNMVKIKCDRIMRTMEVLADAEEAAECEQLIAAMVAEGLDIINYTVFGVRQLEGTS